MPCDCQVVTYLNELIWKYHIFPLDRLLLCMVSDRLWWWLLVIQLWLVVMTVTQFFQVMRGYDGQFAHTSLSLVHHMLLTNRDLQNRVSSLIEEVLFLLKSVMSCDYLQPVLFRCDQITGTAQTGT